VTTSKKHSVEQIIAKLREMEKLTGQGMTIPQAAKKLGITDQTFYRWRTRYGSLKEDEAKRLQILEQENARLKRIIAEQALDISMLKDLNAGKF
jgi:transposase